MRWWWWWWRRRKEKEEEDLFVLNDTIEGPRAPAVRPGRVSVTPFALFTNSGCGRVSEWEKGRGAERLRERKEKERKKREERESGREHR